MDIQPTIFTTTLLTKPTQLNLAQLLLGQILNATVINKKSETSFVLQIGNQHIEARANKSKPLHVGERLKLIVEKQSNPTTLRVLEQITAKVSQEIKQHLLRESMPKQTSLEKLSPVLNQISKNIKETVKTLPAPIEKELKKLIDNLPLKNNINNESGLKAAIKNSGIFMEAKLLTEVNNKSEPMLKEILLNTKKPSDRSPSQSLLKMHQLDLTKDLKNNLIQLAGIINKYKKETKINDPVFIKQAVKNTFVIQTNGKTDTKATAKAIDINLKSEIEILRKTVESSVARIEVNQSKAIVTHDSQSPVWTIEMPIKDKQDIDLLELNIQSDKDSNSDNGSEKLWTTDIKIKFENIGAISARLSLLNNEINATLWSDCETLNGLINNNLSLFNKQIEKCGLATGKIVCLKEAPAKQNSQTTNHRLINIAI